LVYLDSEKKGGSAPVDGSEIRRAPVEGMVVCTSIYRVFYIPGQVVASFEDTNGIQDHRKNLRISRPKNIHVAKNGLDNQRVPFFP